ncbi:hypothetical protein EVJ58_g6773 [Rhodofomes roseus]|uniref:Uncharacterized protein n=1 Tax=Rhodofomes roseus TaxID=34475 RepID=A0A4Y9Y7I0_9APHY|nr:hypothetical protein EVJ58_g6773 [Rhodofomes roseus]
MAYVPIAQQVYGEGFQQPAGVPGLGYNVPYDPHAHAWQLLSHPEGFDAIVDLATPRAIIDRLLATGRGTRAVAEALDPRGLANMLMSTPEGVAAVEAVTTQRRRRTRRRINHVVNNVTRTSDWRQDPDWEGGIPRPERQQDPEPVSINEFIDVDAGAEMSDSSVAGPSEAGPSRRVTDPSNSSGPSGASGSGAAEAPSTPSRGTKRVRAEEDLQDDEAGSSTENRRLVRRRLGEPSAVRLRRPTPAPPEFLSSARAGAGASEAVPSTPAADDLELPPSRAPTPDLVPDTGSASATLGDSEEEAPAEPSRGAAEES